MKPHVLIIEDDPSIADLQKDYLEINDMTVTIEHDGKLWMVLKSVVQFGKKSKRRS